MPSQTCDLIVHSVNTPFGPEDRMACGIGNVQVVCGFRSERSDQRQPCSRHCTGNIVGGVAVVACLVSVADRLHDDVADARCLLPPRNKLTVNEAYDAAMRANRANTTEQFGVM